MLNKKQLEDAAKCTEIDCTDCSCQISKQEDCHSLNGDVAQTALVYREGLEKAKELILFFVNYHNGDVGEYRDRLKEISKIDKLLGECEG